MASRPAPKEGSAARASFSKNFPGEPRSSVTRPARLRVTRPDVEEVLRSPRRGRPKKPPQPPPQEEATEEEGSEPACYDCVFQDEGRGKGTFAPPELVWGKVRSHPWWPGQVFDAADASELALQHRRAGASLVAYFWDRTFAWADAPALCSFSSGFSRLAGQSTMAAFVSAVDAALDEVTRRVEVGLSCSCVSDGIAKKQEVENAGIREGAYGAAVDVAFMRDAFRGEAFVEYISVLAREPLAGANRLDLVIAKTQLKAFNRSRGSMGLPEFVAFEGIEDVVEEMPGAKGAEDVAMEAPRSKRKRLGKGDSNDVSGNEKKSRHGENAACEKVDVLEDGKVLEKGDAIDTVNGKDLGVLSSKGKKLRHGARLVSKDTVSEAGNGISVNTGGFAMPTGEAIGDALSKERKSRRRERVAQKKEHTLEEANGLETVDGGEMPATACEVAKGVLSEKSGCRTRSMRKKEEVLHDANRSEKDDGGEISAGKDTSNVLSKGKKSRRTVGSRRKKEHISEDKECLEEDNGAVNTLSGGKKKPEHGENSASKESLISEDGRKKKKLSELMVETENSNSAAGSKNKARGKRSSHESAEKVEDPGLDLKDSTKNWKRKKLDKFEDLESKPQSPSHRKFSKIGELMSRAAGQMSQTPVIPKANGAASQSASRKAKRRKVEDKSGSPVKTKRGKKGILKEDSTCGEMLSQLSLAAHDPKRRESFAPTAINFFTEYKNSHGSKSLDDGEIPVKVAETKSAHSELPLADHMQDSYWVDTVPNEDHEEEPLSTLRKKKAKGKVRSSKKENQVKGPVKQSSASPENKKELKAEIGQGSDNGKQLKAEIKPCSGNGGRLKDERRSAEDMEDPSLAGLVLNFNRPSAVPSGSDLIKIFSQYGPIKEARTEIVTHANRAQVIFKRRSDAEAAFAGAGKLSALGPALISFRLTYSPSATTTDPPQGASKSEKDSTPIEAVQ